MSCDVSPVAMFFGNRGPTLGRNSQKIPGFFWVASLIAFSTFYSNDVDVAYTASCKRESCTSSFSNSLLAQNNKIVSLYAGLERWICQILIDMLSNME